ncbi:MAG: HAMP domain-containing histidine kinase [Planctomycetes bacterium]|nr:HAMP domain-containing histidine kinase [Planctomycetota bacterium]
MHPSARSALDALSDAAVTFSSDGAPSGINRAAGAIASDAATLMSRLPIDRAALILSAVHGALSAATVWDDGAASEFLLQGSPPLAVRPRVAPIDGGAVLLLRDATASRWQTWTAGQVLATAAHELRSPLTSLRLAVQMCADGSFGALNDQQRDLLQGAVDDCSRLQRSIEDLLDPALLGGPLALQRTRVDVRDALAVAALVGSPGAQDRGITVTIKAAADLIVDADARRLQTVMACMLVVAVSQAASGSTVGARAEATPAGLAITIDAPGATIPASISELFVGSLPLDEQGDPWSAAAFRCWLARRLVAAHGGSLTLAQDAAGARFLVLLPRA